MRLKLQLFCIVLLAAYSLPSTFARAALPSICLQPPPRSEGICTIEIEGYYFDPRTNDCQLYVVGGCRSNPGQSFGSKNDCLATCIYGTRRLQDFTID